LSYEGTNAKKGGIVSELRRVAPRLCACCLLLEAVVTIL